jgi:NAD(P)H dehydrogenase (quinone)
MRHHQLQRLSINTLDSRYAGIFVSTGTPGGGQESTVIAAMSTLAHHGIIYVPLGYKTSFKYLGDLSEARGGSPWGAGTFSAADGSRQPSKMELELAEVHGKAFYEAVSKVNFGSSAWLDGSKAEPSGGVVAGDGANKKEDSTPAGAQPGGVKQSQGQTPSNNVPQKKEKDGEGPCGLPFKCTVL